MYIRCIIYENNSIFKPFSRRPLNFSFNSVGIEETRSLELVVEYCSHLTSVIDCANTISSPLAYFSIARGTDMSRGHGCVNEELMQIKDIRYLRKKATRLISSCFIIAFLLYRAEAPPCRGANSYFFFFLSYSRVTDLGSITIYASRFAVEGN